MKTRFLFTLISVIAVLTGCSKDEVDYGYGDFRIDMATIVDFSQQRGFLLDNQTILVPNTTINSSLKTGARVLVNYVLIQKNEGNNYSVRLNTIGSVNSSSINVLGSNVPDDPLRAEAVWQSGDWLNMRVSFDYFEKKHSIELDRRQVANADTVYLELRHSKNGDSNGYWTRTYLSYPLNAFAKKGTSVPIKLRVNSGAEGIKYFVFNYISPSQN